MTSKTGKSKRIVKDSKGANYELGEELGRGGQGVVYRTHYPQVLVKGFTNKDPRARQRWRKQIQWLIRQDLTGMKLARPLNLLEGERAGYVMELMDGLVPLQKLLDSFAEAENPAEDYLVKGGLRRRIRILCQLARTLNQLHSKGMLFGDLSPNNVFVSDESSFAEVWLIDCDNISIETHSGYTLYTEDYGAPEIVRGESLSSSLTDCWSFAVIAYQLLTHNHPLKGDFVNDAEPEVEEAALRGEYPWINDSNNPDNECSKSLPLQLMENSRLPQLFYRCFEQGMLNPVERPSISEWLEVLSEVDERMISCSHCDGNYLLPPKTSCLDDIQCFFCDEPVDPQLVLFEEFIFLPDDEKQEQYPELESSWVSTGRKVCLQPGSKQELKRLMPSFSYDRWPSDHIRLEYRDKGLGIFPLPEGELHLQRGKTVKHLKNYQGLKAEERGRHPEPYQLHIGSLKESHIIWQFRW